MEGRPGERNALFAELLVTTGLRLEEAASLLAIELPALEQLPSGTRSIPFRLPGSIAKGGRSREIRLPVRLLRRLHDYAGIERANALTRIRRLPSRPLIAAGASNHARFYLTIVDIIGFTILLLLSTGMEMECIFELKADCLGNRATGFVDIAYFKRRAHGTEWKTLRVRDGGLTTPGGLIRLAIRLTERGRKPRLQRRLGRWSHRQTAIAHAAKIAAEIFDDNGDGERHCLKAIPEQVWPDRAAAHRPFVRELRGRARLPEASPRPSRQMGKREDDASAQAGRAGRVVASVERPVAERTHSGGRHWQSQRRHRKGKDSRSTRKLSPSPGHAVSLPERVRVDHAQ